MHNLTKINTYKFEICWICLRWSLIKFERINPLDWIQPVNFGKGKRLFNCLILLITQNIQNMSTLENHE